MKVIYYTLIAILLFGCAINTNKSINEKDDYDSMVDLLERFPETNVFRQLRLQLVERCLLERLERERTF